MNKNYFEDCKAAVKTMLYPDLQPGKTLPEGKLEEFLDMMLMARDEWRNNINRDAILRELKSEIDIGFTDNYIRAHGNEKERDHIEWLHGEKGKLIGNTGTDIKHIYRENIPYQQLTIMTLLQMIF